MGQDEIEIDHDWRGWDEFVELDLTEEREEDWNYDDDDAWIISMLIRESIAADIVICLACGEVIAHCGCD